MMSRISFTTSVSRPISSTTVSIFGSRSFTLLASRDLPWLDRMWLAECAVGMKISLAPDLILKSTA